MFADVRRFSHPSESVGVNRLESVGGVWAEIAKRNNKRRIASDVARSFSRVLKGQRALHIKRIKRWNFRWKFPWTKQEAIYIYIYIASDVTRFFGVCTGLESRNEIISDVSLAMFLAVFSTARTLKIQHALSSLYN